MRILQVSNLLSSVHGGSAEVPYQLSRELASKGHQVTVYAADYGISRDISLPGVCVRAFRTRANWANFLFTPGMVPQAREQIRNLDIIHMHNYRTFQNLVAHRYATRSRVPYVLQAHGSLPRLISRKRLKKLFDRLWGYRLLSEAARVIAVAEMELEQYRAMGVSENRIELVPHGINLDEFATPPEKGAFRQKYGLDGDQGIILYLGRIHKIKGIDLLVQAFADVSNVLPGTRLVVAGPDDGFLRPVKDLVADLRLENRVLFPGPLYGQAKLEAYVDCDVYVLPSSYEIFGITILEAWACGKPVVTTDQCGLADVVGAQGGRVVPYQRESLRDALVEILGNDRLKQQLGEQGNRLVHERFNWNKIGEQVEALYRRILGT